MKNFIIYNKEEKILSTGSCQDKDLKLQGIGNFILEGTANDVTQKVEFDGLDIDGQPINPRVVDKTPAEIEADNPIIPEIPEGQRLAYITNEQWQDVLNRFDKLEICSTKNDE